ncbi:MAG TPA: hypothetical protein VH092_06585, partial [Urbifossiella sp.]|nr:hypothetical protein [Urbifossiella sp.]
QPPRRRDSVNATVRYLFDECIGWPVAEEISRLSGSKATFAHIVQYFGAEGTPDRVWVPQLAAEKSWVVITSDGGKQSRKGDKLPAICLAHDLTHVVLAPSLHALGTKDKVAALLSLWSEIEMVGSNPLYCRYSLRVKDQRGSRATLSFQLKPVGEPRPIPPTEGSVSDDCPIN